MHIDPAFRDYFDTRLHQVFLYITDVCGLRCQQCLYKTTLANREMDLGTTLELLHVFREYGAEKLTFIGGEPTLYGIKEQNKPLFRVIDEAKILGYKYIRLDTNGQSNPRIFQNSSLQKLDNLAFSLDGHTPEINDALRGQGTFARCVNTIKRAVQLGYYVSVTSCIHPGNLYHIDEIIQLVTNLGISEFNMHPLFKMGIDRDNFTGNTDIDPAEWMRVAETLSRSVSDGKYQIPVRIPLRFVRTEEYLKNPEVYNYCPVRLGERVLVHPNGEIRVCALCIGSPFHIATYDRNQVVLNTSNNSEVAEGRLRLHPCMSQTKNFGDLTPLCISYKPFQNEYVWTTQNVDTRLFGSSEPSASATVRAVGAQ